MTDSRHPYTYACDFVRSLGPCNREGVVLSRSDASTIIQGIASVLGMTKEALAEKLSLAEQSKTEDDRQKEVAKLMAALGIC